jgi:hypothetical protein
MRSVCHRRPNAVELLDRQSFDEGRPHLRSNDEKAIGLTMIRGELGEEFCCRRHPEAVRPVSARIFALIVSAICVADTIPFKFSVT